MAQLFSKSTIIKEVTSFSGMNIDDKIAIVKELYEDHKNGRTKDETRYEQRFNNKFFGELLGYEENTNRHPKASTPVGSKIADLGLGFFAEGKYSYDGVRVAVELKGSNTYLDKKQASYGGQSPVDQGFGYKTSFKQCPWLIVSNFVSIRLYRDNKQDYEIWTLEELASGDNDRFELKKLLVLMKKNRLITTSGESYSEKLLSTFRYDQEKITKQFYKEYKDLRLELINDIRSHNKDLEINFVVEKAQKIIDRVIFIHFCEDKGLLPADKLKENVLRAEEAGFTPREILKKFFYFIDKGSPNGEIPEYNGGLFSEDMPLNNLSIGDAICRKFINLGVYDFDDELSVNILGHIFEQSISDLEQLKIDLLGEEVQTDDLVETKTSKRKKDGIFYTPEYIVDYIVQNSLMTWLTEKEDQCLSRIGKIKKGYKNELEAYQAYQQILQNVKVLDPACGSGAFLVKVFDYLYDENVRVGNIIGSLFDDSTIYKSILRNNIYGVDLNSESIEITKLSLWLKSAEKNKKLNNLDKNIKCGNSLINDPEVAGDKAFVWEEEFKDIMDGGGFDVIVGNPPYGANIDSISEWLGMYYPESTKGMKDTYKIFIDKSLRLLKNKGNLGFITPNTFLYQPRYKDVRDILKKHNVFVINLGEKIFDNVEIPTCVFSLSKGQKSAWSIKNLTNVDRSVVPSVMNLIDKFDLMQSSKIFEASIKITNKKIDDVLIIKDGGVKHQRVGVGMGEKGKSDLRSRIYYTSEKNAGGDYALLIGKDINRYMKGVPRFFLRKNYKDILKQNEIVYFDENLMSLDKKIIWRQTADQLRACVCDSEWFANTVQGGYLREEYIGKIDIHYVLCLLNSVYYKFLYQKTILEAGKVFPQVKLQYIKSLPFIVLSKKDQKPFIKKADEMLSLTKIYNEFLQKTLSFLESRYSLEKIPKKLKNFTELDFNNFKKSIKIKKISLKDEEELMSWFTKKCETLSALKLELSALDREIDDMVFDLYGLTEEEKEVVLSN